MTFRPKDSMIVSQHSKRDDIEHWLKRTNDDSYAEETVTGEFSVLYNTNIRRKKTKNIDSTHHGESDEQQKHNVGQPGFPKQSK